MHPPKTPVYFAPNISRQACSFLYFDLSTLFEEMIVDILKMRCYPTLPLHFCLLSLTISMILSTTEGSLSVEILDNG